MARTQTFERDLVVREARSLFWQRGYVETSIPELETATGLSRSSIYNTFGSKRGLFLAVLESYLSEVVRPRLLPFSTEAVHPQAVTAYLEGLRDAFNTPNAPTRNGCLLINTARSEAAEDTQIAVMILAYRKELLDAFSRGIDASHPHSTSTERKLLSHAVTDLVVASFSIARVDPSESARIIENASALLTSRAH